MEFNKSTVLTKLSVHDIERLICGHYDIRKHIIVPNVSWGFFREHEADVVVITKANYLTEIEIKRSWHDFLKDFRKDSYHSDNRIKSFYYCVPECMAQHCLDFIDNLDPKFEMQCGGIGLMYFTEDGRLYERRGYAKSTAFPLTPREVVDTYFISTTLGSIKYAIVTGS